MAAPSTNNYDFKIAQGVLTDTEKDRFLACYLNLNDSNAINWDKASKDFGSASVASFRKMVQTACKKISDAQKNGGALPSPTKAPASGKKRKAAADGDDGEKPVKKGSGGGKKEKADTPLEDEDADAKATVKEEGDEPF